MRPAPDLLQRPAAVDEPPGELVADQGESVLSPIEDRGAHPDTGRPRGDHLHGVDAREHAAGADQGDLDRGGDLVHAAQGDGLQGGSRDAAREVVEHGRAALRVDEHAGHGVDGGDDIGARCRHRGRYEADVGNIGESFTMQGMLVAALTCRVTSDAASAEEANISP